MSEQGTARRAEELARKAARARSWAKALRADTHRCGAAGGGHRTAVSETLAHLAAQRPQHAARLRAMSQAAARQAARERLVGNPQPERP